MITINLLDAVRTPLPTVTPMEILGVCAAAVAFWAVAALSSLELPIS